MTSADTEDERWWTSVPTRATATCCHRVDTRVSPRVRSSCRLSRESSKAYRALSFATWTVILSRWSAVSALSAMKGALYCLTPPRIARMRLCTTFGGARVLRQAQAVFALQGELPVRLQLGPQVGDRVRL